MLVDNIHSQIHLIHHVLFNYFYYNYKDLTPWYLHMMARKRLADEFEEDLTQINPAKNAKLQGMISTISPMKTNAAGTTKYFDGELTDGRANVRLVGFDDKQHQKLAEFQKKQEPVALVNCEVKPSKYGSQLEVVMSKGTQVLKSPSDKFNIENLPKKCEEMPLDQLHHQMDYQRVTVMIKILEEKEVIEVNNGLSKQDYIIADATGTGTLTVWETKVGMLTFKVGSSYKLTGAMVRSFNGKSYLSVPNACEISTIGDIKPIREVDKEVVDRNLKDAVILGVLSLETYKICISCKGKIYETTSSNVGECSKCMMVQRLDRCKAGVTAKLLLESADKTYHLTAFMPILCEICQSVVITKEALLNADQFNFTYSDTNIITSVNM